MEYPLVASYALGAFFVLSHLASGMRVVLIAHHLDQRKADRLWVAFLAMSAIVAAAIVAGMCGVRIGALAS
jgi:CDP-diglyceride synthetase